MPNVMQCVSLEMVRSQIDRLDGLMLALLAERPMHSAQSIMSFGHPNERVTGPAPRRAT